MEGRLLKMNYLLIILHFLLGIGAVFGGLSFIIDPTGLLLKVPLSLLDHSPFSSFLIPGVILFFFLGVAPIVIGLALIFQWNGKLIYKLCVFRDKHWSWSFSLYIGFVLIVWINIQIYIIGLSSVVHLLYILIGLGIQIITLLPSVQNYYSIKGNNSF